MKYELIFSFFSVHFQINFNPVEFLCFSVLYILTQQIILKDNAIKTGQAGTFHGPLSPSYAVLWEDFLPGDLNYCLMMLNWIQKGITSPILKGF
jgi:hypothetical protein